MWKIGRYAPVVFAVANVWLALATSSVLAGSALFRGALGGHIAAHWPQYYLALLLIAFTLALVEIRGQRRRLRVLLKHVLDMAIEHDVPDGMYDDQECKATLYRYSRFNAIACIQHRVYWGTWHAPWGGWLVPYVRSGGNSLRPLLPTVFRAGTSGYHGVAGAVWSKGFYSFSAEVPPTDGRKQNAYEKRTAQSMCLTDQEYARRKRSGRSLSSYIYGGRIEVSAGKRWGVLVVDTPVQPRVARGLSPSPSDVFVVGVLSRAIEWGSP